MRIMMIRRIVGLVLVSCVAACASSAKQTPLERGSFQPAFQKPVQGAVRSPFSLAVDRSKGHWRVHHGIDIPAPIYTPIKASAPGRVVAAETQNGYGKVVIIDHGAGWYTRYAHLSKFEVRAGSMVKPGEKIGLVGKTGNATGPHLHFEIRRNGQPLDPVLYIN